MDRRQYLMESVKYNRPDGKVVTLHKSTEGLGKFTYCFWERITDTY